MVIIIIILWDRSKHISRPEQRTDSGSTAEQTQQRLDRPTDSRRRGASKARQGKGKEARTGPGQGRRRSRRAALGFSAGLEQVRIQLYFSFQFDGVSCHAAPNSGATRRLLFERTRNTRTYCTVHALARLHAHAAEGFFSRGYTRTFFLCCVVSLAKHRSGLDEWDGPALASEKLRGYCLPMLLEGGKDKGKDKYAML